MVRMATGALVALGIFLGSTTAATAGAPRDTQSVEQVYLQLRGMG